jgi:hypothetical protein
MPFATALADSVPDNFTFEDQANLAVSSIVRSNTISITGIDEPTALTIVGGEYSLSCLSAFTSAPTTVTVNTRICVRHRTAATNCTMTDTLLTVGGVSDTFTSTTASLGTDYFDLNGATAPSENACPAWVPELNHDDCSYNASDPSGRGTEQWIGPVFSAGYYAPGAAPPVFTNSEPPSPVVAPAPDLPLDGKRGIPIARGFLSINDSCTVGDPTDDIVGGTLEFGAFERNVATSRDRRVIETFDRIIHFLAAAQVDSATPNADGGLDYVIGKSGMASLYPSLISGSTTAAGGVTDDFPSEVGSQSSSSVADVPYWLAPGSGGLASFEGASAVTGIRTVASVWGYACDDGMGSDCPDSPINWSWSSPAALDNVILRFSTDSSGDISAATAFLVQTNGLSTAITGQDSWQATTLSATGTRDPSPDAFDDSFVVIAGLDEEVGISPLANDVPGEAPVTVAIVNQPAHGTAEIPAGFPHNIAYRLTPGDTFQGVDTFTYRITDNNDATSTATIAAIITDPVICAADSVTSDQDVARTIPVLANDTGANLPPITVRIAQAPASGTAVANADDTITFTPPADTGGSFTFQYAVSEATLDTPAQCQVFVRVDSLPVAVNDTVTAENAATTRVNVLVNDRQLDDTPLTLAITQNPAHGSAVVVPGTDTSLPYVDYTPADGYEGPDSFRYRVTDTDGDVSNSATVSITVLDSVPRAVADTKTVEDAVPTLIDVLVNDTGLTDQPVRIVIAAQPEHGNLQVLDNPQTGLPIIGYTSTVGYAGPDSFRYRIKDGDGDVSNTVAVTITVQDTVPVAVNDTANGSARIAIVLGVLRNDQGLVDTPIRIVITQPPAHGTAAVEAGSGGQPEITYSSEIGYAGPDSLQYRLRDADGDASPQATVAITVNNPAPAAVDDTVAVEDDTPLTIGVLTNDTGLDNRPITLEITRQAEHGSVVVVAPSSASGLPAVRYTPTANYVGGDTFRYRVTDGDGEVSAAADVLISVRNTVPVANNDTAVGDARESTAIDVMANDTGLVDGPFTMQIVEEPANGTAEIVNIVIPGTTRTRPGIAYASNVDFAGTDKVRYRIRDRDGERSNAATLTLTVANPTPVALNDTTREQVEHGIPAGQAIERLSTPIDILANDTGRTNRPNTIIITEQPAHGKVMIQTADVTGLGRPGVTYQSDEDYTGPDSFKYRVRDGDGDRSNIATVSLEVVNVIAAVADGSPFPLGTTRDRPLKVKVLENDGGLSDGPISIEILAELNGKAVVNSDNTITFTPDPGFTGRFPAPDCQPPSCLAEGGGGFRYKLTDAGSQTDEAPVFIDVFPAAVTDTGGSSTFGAEWLLLLAPATLWRRARRAH